MKLICEVTKTIEVEFGTPPEGLVKKIAYRILNINPPDMQDFGTDTWLRYWSNPHSTMGQKILQTVAACIEDYEACGLSEEQADALRNFSYVPPEFGPSNPAYNWFVHAYFKGLSLALGQALETVDLVVKETQPKDSDHD